LYDNNDKLTDELNKLNQLLKDGVLTEEEFKKAKKKILDN
jgi:predicted Zn-dependent peptidase